MPSVSFTFKTNIGRCCGKQLRTKFSVNSTKSKKKFGELKPNLVLVFRIALSKAEVNFGSTNFSRHNIHSKLSCRSGTQWAAIITSTKRQMKQLISECLLENTYVVILLQELQFIKMCPAIGKYELEWDISFRNRSCG